MRQRGGGKAFPVTLNASGLPIGRTIAALLEQNQRTDGSVMIPPALIPYTGFAEISQASKVGRARDRQATHMSA